MFNRTLLAAALIAALSPVSALAQDSGGITRPDGVSERFTFRLGGVFPTHDTFTRLQPADLPTIPGIDLERDTGFADNTTDFRFEAAWRPGRRHEIRLGWFEMNRSSTARLSGEIEWGDEVFPIDAEITGSWDTRVIKLDYRYSLIKKERVDFGLSAGLFVMRVASGIGLAGSAEASNEDVNRTAPLPMLGADVDWLVADRFMLRAGAQYFAISIDDSIDGSWLEARAALEWSATRNLGIGAGYLLADIDVAAELSEAQIAEFEYRYKFNGPTVYAIVSF